MNTLDTRDLNDRLEELEDARQLLEEALEDAETPKARALANKDLDAWDEENGEELKELQNLRDEVGREWSHGETLIPEDDFPEYCEELLKDCGDLPSDIPWYIVIDWEATARNIKADYSEVDYQGTTYLFRS